MQIIIMINKILLKISWTGIFSFFQTKIRQAFTEFLLPIVNLFCAFDS